MRSHFQLIVQLSPLFITMISARTSRTINQKCQKLLTCAVRKNCIKVANITDRLNGSLISMQMYNNLDQSIDYGCIFAFGCFEECNKCSLCRASKEQLVDALTGTKHKSRGECSSLTNCATRCVQSLGSNFTKVNYCLRHRCAYHCFDGSCAKCSAFVTRLFNQICLIANLRRIANYKGQCYEMFRAIVHEKFEAQFKRSGLEPAIDIKTNLLWSD